MASKQLLTTFGATGNQGGSIISTVLSHANLSEKYALRGITRDPNSAKSQSLISKGVEMIRANLDDPDSLRTAVRGAHGVFGVTDFWAVMSKDIEIRQGLNIFEACQAEGVQHFVWSSLPYAEKLTGGVLSHVDHFDSKAMVEEEIEKRKGGMVVSYFMPGKCLLTRCLREIKRTDERLAMFINVMKSNIRLVDGTLTLGMPFPSEDIAWPLFVPQHDAGSYVMGLFEGGSEANGAHAHAVSVWTTPKEVIRVVSQEAGRKVQFKTISTDDYEAFYPNNMVGKELAETMRLVGEYNYYGKGEEKKQGEYDRWLIPGAEKMGLEQWVKENGPWKWA